MRKIFILLLVGGCFLAGCSGNDEDIVTNYPDEPTRMPINIAAGMWTRATDSAFEQNDKAGIYVVNYVDNTAGTLSVSGNHVNNMRFTYSGTWTPDTPIYWKDQTTKADFYCYYPYAAGISNISAYPFAVHADQHIETEYKASDFLWGKTAGVTPTADPVQITIKHVMSNLLIYLKAGQGYNEEDLHTAQVTICGLKTQATIDLATGKATATGEIADITPLSQDDCFRALVVPQNVAETALVKIEIGGNEYTLMQNMTFEANKQHSCTITVNRTGEGINIGIGSWETDDTDSGGTVE